MSRYINFLFGLKDPGEIVVASIAGPMVWGQQGAEVTVEVSEYGQPQLDYSCTSPNGDAVPAVRLRTFAQYFSSGSDIDFTYRSICDPEYNTTLEFVGTRIGEKLGY